MPPCIIHLVLLYGVRPGLLSIGPKSNCHVSSSNPVSKRRVFEFKSVSSWKSRHATLSHALALTISPPLRVAYIPLNVATRFCSAPDQSEPCLRQHLSKKSTGLEETQWKLLLPEDAPWKEPVASWSIRRERGDFDFWYVASGFMACVRARCSCNEVTTNRESAMRELRAVRFSCRSSVKCRSVLPSDFLFPNCSSNGIYFFHRVAQVGFLQLHVCT